MTAHVVDSAGLTQTGNVRRSNEDSFLLRSPLFMVADGMGGALAGELASRMCAEAFAELDLIEHQGEEALRATIGVANRRIWERSRTDAEASGMGTTVTAALVGPNGAVVVRARRRQPRVPPARRRPPAPVRGPLAGARARAPGRAVRGRGRAAPSAQRDHARARHRRGGADRHLLARGPARRRAAPVHRRPEHDDLRAGHRGRPRHRRPRRPTSPAGWSARRSGLAARTTSPRSSSASVRPGPRTPTRRSRRAASSSASFPPTSTRSRRPRDLGGRRAGLAQRPRSAPRSAPRRSSWSSSWRSPARSAFARAISSAPTRRPAGSRSTRACRSSCRSASTSTTSIYESRVSYVSLPPDQRRTLFDHTLRSESSAHHVLRPVRGGQPVRSERMRELWNLGWVGGLTAIGFLSVYTARQNEISSASLTYAGGVPRRLRPGAHRRARRTAAGRPVAPAAGGTPVRPRPDRDLPAEPHAGARPVGLGRHRPARVPGDGVPRPRPPPARAVHVPARDHRGRPPRHHDGGRDDDQRREAVASVRRRPGAARRVRKAAARRRSSRATCATGARC